MSMYDDPGVRLLERDLRQLAEPRAGDDELQRAIRARLTVSPDPPLRRRRSMRLAVAPMVVAAAVVVAIALVGTSGPSGPAAADAAIIHHALIAVTAPANTILHVKLVSTQGRPPVAGESWQQTSAPYANRYIKGLVGHQGDFSDDGTTTFEYDPATNTIYQRPDSGRATFTNPISQIRQELANGQAQAVGSVVIDGTSLYKIDLPNGLVGYFEKGDYRPRYLDNPQGDGGVLRFRVAAYEYLPMTRSNQALLSVSAQHPGARIDTNPSHGPGKK